MVAAVPRPPPWDRKCPPPAGHGEEDGSRRGDAGRREARGADAGRPRPACAPEGKPAVASAQWGTKRCVFSASSLGCPGPVTGSAAARGLSGAKRRWPMAAVPQGLPGFQLGGQSPERWGHRPAGQAAMRARQPERKPRGRARHTGLFSDVSRAHGRGERWRERREPGASLLKSRVTVPVPAGERDPLPRRTWRPRGARGRGLAVPRATTRSGSFVPYWVPFCDFAEVKVIRAFGEQAPLRIRRA